MSFLFLAETTMILVPAVTLRIRRVRETPRALLNMGALACLGGMFYRFIPTSIAYKPAYSTRYFPSTPELVMAVGYIALGTVVFVLAAKPPHGTTPSVRFAGRAGSPNLFWPP